MGGKKEKGREKVFELILEIGHKATLLQKKLPNGYTHKWNVFVKGHNNSKIEHCISKVVFQLHESFENPSREISESPFQIKETGYAGFEIPIQVYFKNRDQPNHVVFVHDLCLLANKPNDSITVEKIKFINPNKEFEKCLIKSGAQLLPVVIKKERSNSPPVKKHKSSSSLIPSKDIDNKPAIKSQQSLPSQQSTQANTNHHHSNSGTTTTTCSNSGSSNNNNNTNNNSTSSSHNNHNNNHHHNHHNNNHHHHQNNHDHQSPKQHHQHHHHNNHHNNNNHQKHNHHQKQSSTSKKPKSSNEFIDVFGAPLVYNNSKSKDREVTVPSQRIKQDVTSLAPAIPATTKPKSPVPPPPLPVSIPKPAISPTPPAPLPTPVPASAPAPAPAKIDPVPTSLSTSVPTPTVPANNDNELPINGLQLLQTKLACLSDTDRLQKIVDIIEAAGENFQLTSKKFQFDLKNFDKRTIYKIEKTLQQNK